ncbi:hypothetical protein [Tsukamurella soli]|uniref:Uncharacterized protein n=1 Tax=Tsukamurella soli TaxID=644556 RepID=A0ABP8J6J3_9ACTN
MCHVLNSRTAVEAVYERAYRMGRVSAADRTAFHRALNARGWKKSEPDDDLIPAETPRLAASLGEALRTRAGMSREEVARMTGRRTPAGDDPFLPAERRLRTV